MLVTILAIILVLGGLIFFHELGHFLVARILGMGVSTFSLGFGPKLLKHKFGKTEYALSLVPLGGYVALVGESDSADIPEDFTKEESFALRPAWQRLLVIAAGPIANILLAWFICWFLAWNWGVPVLQPVIGGLQADSPALRAGLEVGDRILSIDGERVNSWEEMSEAIARSDGRPMRVEVLRPEKREPPGDASDETGTVIPLVISAEKSVRKSIFGEDETAWLIGVRAGNAVSTQPEGFLDASVAGARQTWEMVALTWKGFVKLAQRVVPLDQVGGPIMIAQMVGERAHQGLPGLLALTALISVNLGVLNLLPIPVLDGGQIMFCIYEMIFRRPLPLKAQDYATRVGLFLLIALMVLATFNDVWRLIK
ncbi:MAG: RIP metalloprotease RseP [Desulfovibrio sp.]|nr:RIP metalloprotease RseP [Desulfovibrio sp.]